MGKKLNLAAAVAVSLFTAAFAHANPTLVVTDFLTPGDNLIVTDTSTGIQWLKPFYTLGQTYDDSFVQSLIANYHLVYATETEVLTMIDSNFGILPASPGTPAGFNQVESFFTYFGINELVSCGSPCPRTQGLTSTIGSSPNTHVGVGLIQIGSNGYIIDPNPWPDTGFIDPQMGNFLILAPEPATWVLCGIGIAFAVIRRRRKSAALSEPLDRKGRPD